MKKLIILILIFVSVKSYSQRIIDLPTKTTYSQTDYLLLEPISSSDNTSNIQISNFLRNIQINDSLNVTGESLFDDTVRIIKPMYIAGNLFNGTGIGSSASGLNGDIQINFGGLFGTTENLNPSIGMNFNGSIFKFGETLNPLIFADFTNSVFKINGRLELNDGNNNVLVGDSAGHSLVGNTNVLVGYFAGGETNGTDNVIIGNVAGEASTGSDNIYIGDESGQQANGNANVFIGDESGENNTGSDNVFLGDDNGQNTDGSGNVFIGHDVGKLSGTANNELRIGNNSTTNLIEGNFTNNTLTLANTLEFNDSVKLTSGNFIVEDTVKIKGRIGMGVDNPLAAIHINKGTTIADGIMFGTGGTGIYENISGTLSFAAAGALKAYLGAGQFYNPFGKGWSLAFISATATDPVYRFSGDADSGIGAKIGGDNVSIIAGAKEIARACENITEQFIINPQADLTGTLLAPNLAFGDGDAGDYEPLDDVLVRVLDSIEVMRWTKDTVFVDSVMKVNELQVEKSITLIDGSSEVHKEGKLFYDTAFHAVNFYNDISNVNHPLGFAVQGRYYNNTGSTITKGTALTPLGSVINGVVTPTANIAGNGSLDSLRLIALASADVLPGEFSNVTLIGALRGLNTSAFNDNDLLYVGHNGQLTNIKPSSPDFSLVVGQCFYADNDSGVIYMLPENRAKYDPSPSISASFTRESETITNPGINTPALITNATNDLYTVDYNVGFSEVGDTIAPLQDGVYSINGVFSFQGDATQSDDWRVGICINRVEIFSVLRTSSTNNKGVVALGKIATLNSGDWVSIRVENTTDAARDAVFTDGVINIEFIDLQ
jgi:hypothetical protein